MRASERSTGLVRGCAGDRRGEFAPLDFAPVTRPRTPRAALATLATLTQLAFPPALALSSDAAAQSTRVDLTGPFVHVGGVVGSVSGQSGVAGDTHTGNGWSIGGGLNLGRSQALVGNYVTFKFRDAGAPVAVPMEQTEVGARARVGGVHARAIFYVEGGGAKRRTSLTAARVFGGDPPSGAGELVDVDGWAGWFGPGLQWYFRRRMAGEVNVAWAWGKMDRAHVQGTTMTLSKPVTLTTLRLRCGLAVTVF